MLKLIKLNQNNVTKITGNGFMPKLLLVFSGLLLSSCLAVTKPGVSTTASGPEWITGSSDLYPSSQYLVGVGNSRGQERAKEKARADLVKTIKVKINATSNLKERASQHETKAGVREEIQRSQVVDIKSTSLVEMKNIRIEDTWYNKKSEEYYALAVLARAKASADLSIEMNELDAETTRQINTANDSQDLLNRISYLNKAIKSQTRRSVLKGYLSAINSSAAALQAGQYDLDTLRNKTLKVLRTLLIYVDTKNNDDDSRSLDLYAKAGLTSSGYTPNADQNTQYVLEVILDKENALYKNKLYWVFANLELKLKNRLTNKVRGACSWTLKEASQNESRANKKVLARVEKIFKTEFDTIFSNFISATPCEKQ